MNDQENVIVGKGEKTKAIQDHLIEDGHHDEAEAFSVVDFLVREYLLCPKDDLHEGAFKIRELLSDIVGAWQPRQPEQAIAEKVLNWFANSRVGLSSKTMAMVACGIIPDEVHHPYDPDDLSRCIVLLDMVPEVRNHFDAISDLNNKWASLIQHWDEIESAYREEDAFGWSRVKRPSKTYTMMRNVLAVCEGGGA